MTATAPRGDPEKARRIALGADDLEPPSSNGHTPAAAAEWDPPLPLGRTVNLPPFPTSALPPWLRDFVLAVAEATQTPADLAGVLVLTALATAAGGRALVEVIAGWREPLNLFPAVAMAPGSRKSAVFARVTQPLTVDERAAIDAARPQILEAVVRRKAADRDVEQAEAEAGKTDETDKAGRDKAIADAIAAAQMAEAITVPAMPRLLADDATPEALASLLAEQGGRVSVLSAEGDVFDAMAGRYSASGPNLAVYLKGHAGDPLRVDRKGRPPEHIPAPALTVGIAVQPHTLTAIADRPGFRGRGLLARFLYSLPESNIGRRRIGADPVPEPVGAAYDAELSVLVHSLAEWTDPAVLTLTAEARAELFAFAAELEPRLAPGADLGHVADWAAKLVGATVRIAGLLHLAAEVRTGWAKPIQAATIRDAIGLARYFADHAVAVFDLMAADPLTADARAVAAWATGREHFTAREAHRAHEARFAKAADLDPVLDLLEARGWIRRRPLPAPSPKGGRPPSPTYDVNPHEPRHNRHNRHNPSGQTRPDPRGEVLSVVSVLSTGKTP